MTEPTLGDEELVSRAVALNYEIVVAHGLTDGGVGFEWEGLFIHDPFSDPQYGAFQVDPVSQYGAAYLGSIFVTDPATALQLAKRQLRASTSEDLTRYCEEHGLDATTVIAAIGGVEVMNSVKTLEELTDEQVVGVWSHVDGATRQQTARRQNG